MCYKTFIIPREGRGRSLFNLHFTLRLLNSFSPGLSRGNFKEFSSAVWRQEITNKGSWMAQNHRTASRIKRFDLIFSQTVIEQFPVPEMRHAMHRAVLGGDVIPIKHSQNQQKGKPPETQIMQGFFIITT